MQVNCFLVDVIAGKPTTYRVVSRKPQFCGCSAGMGAKGSIQAAFGTERGVTSTEVVGLGAVGAAGGI